MNVFEKLEAGHYKNKDPYPKMREVVIEDIPGYKVDRNNHPDYKAAKNEYREAQAVWRDKEFALHGVFREDLLEHLGISRHPKANLLYHKAWERGHSSGLYEVAQVAEDLVELILE